MPVTTGISMMSKNNLFIIEHIDNREKKLVEIDFATINNIAFRSINNSELFGDSIVAECGF